MSAGKKHTGNVIQERMLMDGLDGSPLKINTLLEPLNGRDFKIFRHRAKKRFAFKKELKRIKNDFNITIQKMLLVLTILYFPVFGLMVVLKIVDLLSPAGIITLAFYGVLTIVLIVLNSERKRA
jgi:hypothetical protein